MELLETSAMTNGQHVRARLTFKTGGLAVAPHIHTKQDETYEVISGRLAYVLDGVRHVAEPGEIVTLPRGVAHQHFAEGEEDAIAIQTISPGLDFDCLLESIFGLASENRSIHGLDRLVQGLVWINKTKSTLILATPPEWVQRGLAIFVAPIAYLAGYRAVHERFSGEEW
jgi:mannose-6-phosphate isomerase-like protein (cupin superfamily)